MIIVQPKAADLKVLPVPNNMLTGSNQAVEWCLKIMSVEVTNDITEQTMDTKQTHIRIIITFIELIIKITMFYHIENMFFIVAVRR